MYSDEQKGDAYIPHMPKFVIILKIKPEFQFVNNSFSFLNFLSKRLSRQLEPGVVVIAYLHPEPFSPLI